MANSTADGSVVIDVNMDVSDAEHELARLKKKILHLESDLDEKTFKRGGISSELIQARKELESAGVAFGYQEYDDIAKRTSEINAELREYQDNLINLNAETEKLGKSTANTNKAVKRMGGRIMELAKSAFIFNVISRALTSLQ